MSGKAPKIAISRAECLLITGLYRAPGSHLVDYTFNSSRSIPATDLHVHALPEPGRLPNQHKTINFHDLHIGRQLRLSVLTLLQASRNRGQPTRDFS